MSGAGNPPSRLLQLHGLSTEPSSQACLRRARRSRHCVTAAPMQRTTLLGHGPPYACLHLPDGAWPTVAVLPGRQHSAEPPVHCSQLSQ